MPGWNECSIYNEECRNKTCAHPLADHNKPQLQRGQSQCRTMASQRPCGSPWCGRPECNPKPVSKAVKLGDMPVPVVLTRDEVLLIRGMIFTRREEPAPGLLELWGKIDAAEDMATIAHAEKTSGLCERCGKSLLSHFGYCGMDL